MNQIIQYNNYLKPRNKLPKYISYDKYNELRNKIGQYYDKINMPNGRNKMLKVRDKLLVDFMFATGGRIGDCVRTVKNDIDFENKVLRLRIKKTKNVIDINLDQDLCYNIMNYCQLYKIEDRLFNITPTGAWYIIQKFGKLIDMKLHPHMFRHGLALHLLNQGINPKIIQYRLGHKDVSTTLNFYMIVTPEVEKKILENVEWRI